MRQSEASYLARIAELPCVLCELLGRETVGVHIHHLRENAGIGRRSAHWLCMPLCPTCHVGKHGVHGDRQLLRQAKVDEVDLLAATIERLNR